MKEIIIKAIRFTNFKGLRDLTISFPAKNIDISGDNGLGKSSIFDGVTWVLFGKNRLDRKRFGIKTLDRDNNPIPRIPHMVEIDLTVNGEPVKLARRYEEKWIRPKGSATEKFDGHEETRLYNNVPCSVDEWTAKIDDLCSEDVFKFLTNPLYFSSQKMEIQREMLIRMAGGISDAEVAAGNEAFTKLLALLSGKSMEDFRKEVKADIQRVKKEIKDLPGQIKEKERETFVVEDWSALEAERDRLSKERTDIMNQLSDASAAVDAQTEEKLKIQRNINSLRSQIKDREFQIEQDVKKGFREESGKRQELVDEHSRLSRRLSTLRTERQQALSEADRCTQERSRLIGEYNDLLKASKALVAKYNTEPQFAESDFCCPTCGHQYDIDRIEEIQANAIKTHRAKVSKEQEQNAAAIAENKRQGKANNDRKERHLSTASDLGKDIKQGETRLTEIEAMHLYKAAPVEPDATPAIAEDAKIKDLNTQISTLEESLKKEPEKRDTTELQDKADSLSEQIMDIAIRLSKRGDKEAHDKRLKELQSQLQTGNNEISRLEGLEFTMAEFSKARINKVEDKINSLFSLVRFKMFNTQVNGSEEETCEAIMDGVPFSDLNDAGKINAGLDIINAICKYEGIYAPIFIDNAESINRPLHTESQRIRLIVTKEQELVIRPSDNNPTLF